MRSQATQALNLYRRAVSANGITSTLRSMAKAPLIGAAKADIDRLEQLSIAQLIHRLGGERATINGAAGERHPWQFGEVEASLVALAVHQREAREVFEIGTFDGGTTLLIAQSLVSQDGRVRTIDLPDDRFDLTQSPTAFTSKGVGRAFRDAPERDRIEQLRGDSLTFDFSPWRGKIDLVFVDGAHDYEHGFADSRTALSLVAPGGMIIWDDFEPYWHGLVSGILEAVAGRPLAKVKRTSLAVLWC